MFYNLMCPQYLFFILLKRDAKIHFFFLPHLFTNNHITPNSFPTLTNAFIALSKSSIE